MHSTTLDQEKITCQNHRRARIAHWDEVARQSESWTGWGQYREDVSDHYYPYREAIHYILAQHPQDKCQLTSLGHRYLHQFYVRPADLPSHRLDPRPPGKFERRIISREEWADSDAVLLKAKEDGFKHVVFQVLDGHVPSPPRATGFELNRVFRNSAHSVVLFSLKEER